MKEAGIQPDCVTYTTVIDGYKRTNDLNKCWELFLDTRGDPELAADEMLLSYMVRLAGKTHESEKALRIFSELETEGFHQEAKYYNSIISALGSTKRYAEQAIQYWQKMQLTQIEPDAHTFVAVFRACAKVGDVQTAYDALQDMRLRGFPLTEHSYNGLIRTYAGAAA